MVPTSQLITVVEGAEFGWGAVVIISFNVRGEGVSDLVT